MSSPIQKIASEEWSFRVVNWIPIDSLWIPVDSIL